MNQALVTVIAIVSHRLLAVVNQYLEIGHPILKIIRIPRLQALVFSQFFQTIRRQG